MKLHVAGAFKFLEYHVIHAASGLDEGGGEYCYAAAFAGVSGGAEEFLGLIQRSGVQTSGKSPSRGRLHQVVSPCKSCDRVHKYDHIFSVLAEPFCPFKDHLGDLYVVLRLLVEGGIDDVAFYGFLHVGDFLGTLVYKKDYELNAKVLLFYGFGDLLEKRCLSCLRRRNYKAALALSYRRYEVCEPHGQGAAALFKADALLRVNRCEVGKIPAALCDARFVPVDGLYVKKRSEALSLVGLSHNAEDLVSSL